MTITLAPMEGVVDEFMRDILTRIGGYDLCVTEFVRVSQRLLPASSFYRYCPELLRGGKTSSGIPVHVQLMGGEANVIAENAAFAVELGAPGIDINFGCPAKTVNRHNAGASLLQWPEILHEIVYQVRKAVPKHIPVSAKMRLGFEDNSLALENARAIEAAGAGKLTVHARTKLEGYRPPAHWDQLALIKETLTIPMVANGDIWSVDDGIRCQKISGCQDIMVGRGAIARPDLARSIKRYQLGMALDEFIWRDILDLLAGYYDLVSVSRGATPSWISGRLKQWIKLLGRTYPEATELFSQIRRCQEPQDILSGIKESRICILKTMA
jgi:tRNA-dihydrouridine synthase C